MASDTERLQERVQKMVERGRALLLDPAQAVEQGRALLHDPTQVIALWREMAGLAFDVGRWALTLLPFGGGAHESGARYEAAPMSFDATPEERDEAAAPAPAPPVTEPEPAPAPPPEAEAEAAEAAPEATGETVAEEPAAEGDESPGRDQLYKVLRVLHDEAGGEGRYLTAREIAEASAAAGRSILAGNVRKILRTRAARHVEARLRDGESGKVTEFRLGARGRSWFEKTYVH